MAMIVTGSFQTFDDAEITRRRLLDRQFRRDDVSIFFLNPHGQHARFPTGGDTYADSAAKPGGRGAILGTVQGVGIGLLLGTIAMAIGHLPWWVPVGAMLVGAYLGAFSGALAKMRGRAEEGLGAFEHTEHGVVLAAHVTESNATTAEEILQATGAMAVERVDGDWHDGKWHDFDPIRKPDEA